MSNRAVAWDYVGLATLAIEYWQDGSTGRKSAPPWSKSYYQQSPSTVGEQWITV